MSTHTQATATTVRSAIVVEAPIERAFRVFTEDFDRVKPREHNLEKTSEVEVRFIAESAERTRVELEHRNLDRHGEGWEGALEAVGGDGGWPVYLQRFGGLITAGG